MSESNVGLVNLCHWDNDPVVSSPTNDDYHLDQSGISSVEPRDNIFAGTKKSKPKIAD